MNVTFCVVIPLGVVTTIFCAPAVPAGVFAVMVEEFTTTIVVADPAPILTVDPAIKFVPVIVMEVPPAKGPEAGVTLTRVGSAAT